MSRPVILNSLGKPIVLNEMEQLQADSLQRRITNDLGFKIDITTLTTIMKKVTEQKFFEIAPADQLPVRVGEGSFSSSLLTYRSFQIADDFSTGIINTGGNSSKLAQADTGVDSLSIKVNNWAKQIGWSLMELQQAAKAGNWDLVTAKERARKKNWDLGIQKVAFLGLTGDSSVLGLYNQSGITTNTTLITGLISAMDVTAMGVLLAGLLAAYRANSNYTAWPTHFLLPENDYVGLGVPYSASFPNVSKIEYMETQLKIMTKNSNFKILPNAYGIPANNSLGKTRYILLNYDEESLRMDIPVDYTNTLANSTDNFSFQNVGYGQFTGVLAYRPKEMLYLEF